MPSLFYAPKSTILVAIVNWNAKKFAETSSQKGKHVIGKCVYMWECSI